MRRFRLIVEYDGTDFHGWQYQADCRSVEGCLREALSRLTTGAIETAGASRTDTGVHARGQSVLAVLDTELEPAALRRALQAHCPPDIGVLDCREADEGFHPRFSAVEKRYLYRIFNSAREPVFSRRHAWWVPQPLDVVALEDGAQRLVGEHDFAAFQNRSKDEPESTRRTVTAAAWSRHGDILEYQVIGRGFLYRMVRNMVGTLVDVGRGRWSSDDVTAILESRDRRRAGQSAPPQGLFLMEVAYEDSAPCALRSEPLLL